MTQATLQATVGDECRIDDRTFAMLTSLSSFRVGAFRPRGEAASADVPLISRLTIMGQAIISMAAASLPPPQPRAYEYRICRARIASLFDAFREAIRRIRAQTKRFRAAAADPQTIRLLAGHINSDMEAWSNNLLTEATRIAHAFMASPPDSADALPALPLPQWEHLFAYLSSNMMALWEPGHTAGQRSYPNNRSGHVRPRQKINE
ncbi:unnamed protein product, partial [Scytosiphon promiscuus]